MKKAIGVLIIVLVITGCLVSCADKKQGQEEIVVFAASSMTESMTDLAEAYQKDEPDIKIVYNFSGSQMLKTAIENGSKADIFISANISNAQELQQKGFLSSYRPFLKNRLVIIKSLKSKYHIKTLRGLAQKGIRIAAGDVSVPVGSYWNKAFTEAFRKGIIDAGQKIKITANIKTTELNVKDIVSKVLIDEVDAGIVYRTDINEENKDKLEEIDIPLFSEFKAEYPIAILKSSESNPEVKKFYDYIISDKAKKIFAKYRFIF
jgi:molybdate transport system substrate-binding protein